MQVKTVLLFLGGLGGGEILMILLVVLLLFGARRIPAFARSLGSGIREFKDAIHGMRNELERSVPDEEPPVSSSTSARPDQPETPFTHPQTTGSDPMKAREPEGPPGPGIKD
jgi:sec-independent protein translocase protein TatA